MDMKKLIEAVDQFAGQAVGQKPGDQVRGTEKATTKKSGKHPFAGRLVGASESQSLLADLEKELVEGAVKRGLVEEFAAFKEQADEFAPSQRAATNIAASGWRRGGEMTGTGLQGYVNTDYKTLVKTFGEPYYVSDDPTDKVAAEWVITFKDSKVATIYVYRTKGVIPKETYRWHVGGQSHDVVVRVAALLGTHPVDDLGEAAEGFGRNVFFRVGDDKLELAQAVSRSIPFHPTNKPGYWKFSIMKNARPEAAMQKVQQLEQFFGPRVNERELSKSAVEEAQVAYNKKTGQMGVDNTDPDQRHGLYINNKLVKTVDGAEAANNLKKRDPRFKDATVKKIAEEVNLDPQGVAEEMTPASEFLSKTERLKAGDKVYYQGKFVGVATGDMDHERVVFKPVNGFGTNPNFASLPVDLISLRESNQFSELELAIMEGGNSLEGDDMFADRNAHKIGKAIIKAGKGVIEDAPSRWEGDAEMIEYTLNDGRDMIKIGQTYIDQGMEAGNEAFWDVDTAVRDEMYDAVLDIGIDMNDILDENLNESRLMHSDSKVNVFYKPGHNQTKAQMVARMVPNSQVDRIIASLVNKFGVKSTDFEWSPANRDQYQFTNENAEFSEPHNPQDSVSVDIPLLIRLLEYAREDAKTDMDLHNVAERLIKLSANGQTLSMDQYDQICPGQETVDEDVPPAVATAGGPAGANQPKTIAPAPGTPPAPGVAPAPVDPAQQALQKQNQAKLQQNLANLKTAGVQIDPAKAAQTLQKTDTGAPMNAMDKDTMAAMAPAIGNVMSNPSTATQLNTLIKKAGGGV